MNDKGIFLNWQDQFDIVKLRDKLNELIGIDTAIGISMKWLDLKEIFEEVILTRNGEEY